MAELDLLRHFCVQDFWTFFLYGIGAQSNPKGKRWIDPQVHEPIARWYQKHVDEWLAQREDGHGEQKHLAVVIHREVGKTTMIPLAGQLWLHLRDPEMSSYTGCESTPQAMKTLGAIKAVLDGSDPYALFTKLYGNWASNARTWAGSEIVHSARKNTSRRDPSLGTFSVEKTLTGAHPDAIFYDDPISLERLETDQNWFQSVNMQVTSLIPVIQSDGLVVWTGTRYGDNDHFGEAFRTDGVASFTGTPTDSIEVSPDGKWHVYFMAGKDAEGNPTTPKVWSIPRMDALQKRDPVVFSTQVMNDPNISEDNPITKDQLRQCMVKATEVPWNSMTYVITTDTAFWDGKSAVGKDETVMIVHGLPRNGSGDVYVIEGYGSPTWRAEDFGKRLVATVQRYRRQGRRITHITDEVTMAGKKGSWRLSLQNFFSDVNEPMPSFLELDRGGVKKLRRIEAAASFWTDGHVRIIEGAPGVERLLEQMAKIGQYRLNKRLHDDWADAHADVFYHEIYRPMKRHGPIDAPYMRGARAIALEGLDQDIFQDDEVNAWMQQNPRPPIR